MRYIGFEREEEAEAWARKKLALPYPPSFFRAIATVDHNNEFVFVVILTNFSDRNVDINIAIEGDKMTPKCTIEIFNEVFHFLFDVLHLVRVTGLTGSENRKAKKIIEHFGFVSEGNMRKAYPNHEDLLVYGFLAEEYHQHRWYRSK
jgi:hypothetical protein